jgi:hypothetical protein
MTDEKLASDRALACKAAHPVPLVRVAAILIAWLAAMLPIAPAMGSITIPEVPLLSLSAFGTLSDVHSSESQADFAESILVPNGAGYTRSWSPEVDSLVGVQLDADLTAGFSAVLQVIAEQNYDGTYRPQIEWANIKYQVTPDFNVRIGRVDLPTFLFSATRKVGYTYLWVRPPIELYGLNPVGTNDGLDVGYRLHLGKVTETLRSNVGQSSTPLPNGEGRSLGRNSWGLNDTIELGPLTIMLTYQATHLSIRSLDPLFDAFRQFGPEGVAIANQYDDDNKPLEIEHIGASYDSGHWLLISEWAHSTTHSILGDQNAWYASGGYRIGKFTPYATYAQVKELGNATPTLNLSGLPPGAAGFAAGLNAGLNSVLEGVADQRTLSTGVRWDFAKNFDFKLQFDHTRVGARSSGTLINVQPGFVPGGTVNLTNLTVDFVF